MLRRENVKSKLVAHLFRSDGIIYDMPTEELLVSLRQVTQRSALAGQTVPSNSAAIYGFLQTLKRTMQASRTYNENKEA
jgi:hypothetical protein